MLIRFFEEVPEPKAAASECVVSEGVEVSACFFAVEAELSPVVDQEVCLCLDEGSSPHEDEEDGGLESNETVVYYNYLVDRVVLYYSESGLDCVDAFVTKLK